MEITGDMSWFSANERPESGVVTFVMAEVPEQPSPLLLPCK